jgi:hypothetical protein
MTTPGTFSSAMFQRSITSDDSLTLDRAGASCSAVCAAPGGQFMRQLMIIALGCWGLVLPACNSDSPGSGGNASDSFMPSGPTNDTQTAPNDTQSPPAGADQVPNDTQTAPNDTQHTPWNSPGSIVVSGAGGTSPTTTQTTGGSTSTTTQTSGGSTSTTTQSSCSTTDNCADCAVDSCDGCRCTATLAEYPTSECDGYYC